MFVTNKRKIDIPCTVEVNGNLVEVVVNFKLLGVVIDNRLNFLQHVSELRTSINKRIHSINRLFFLAYKVRLQFFKSFILPFFDYCSSYQSTFQREQFKIQIGMFTHREIIINLLCLLKIFEMNLCKDKIIVKKPKFQGKIDKILKKGSRFKN
ncbi:RNA-directed DNA polymerase from mobile element jockey-like [Brachionus plicatilis]|uniref:RNA-directed DNA polymerase from mobile element jockey-like n=1 Tax=Brachionus plicatilis TaxID=10195 RepID=A0A3M7QXW3_BRAPC|nr:RNA-directed DNA polymerase from mobile element jockey-like [Brachionus plicatilis]